MYNIKFIRSGQKGNINKTITDGVFTKSFNTIAEIAKYMIAANNVYLLEIDSLTKEERNSLFNKYAALKLRHLKH